VREYLENFRADSIARDVEAFRTVLSLPRFNTILGQSYGGFTLASMLCGDYVRPKKALFTGGIPPIGVSVEDVYRGTFKTVLRKNREYYERFPGDVAVVREIVRSLIRSPRKLPGGGTLTARRFLMLGIGLGGGPGAFERLHYLLDGAFVNGDMSVNFLREVEGMQPFDGNPLYYVLHESIYMEGRKSGWAAERVIMVRFGNEQGAERSAASGCAWRRIFASLFLTHQCRSSPNSTTLRFSPRTLAR